MPAAMSSPAVPTPVTIDPKAIQAEGHHVASAAEAKVDIKTVFSSADRAAREAAAVELVDLVKVSLALPPQPASALPSALISGEISFRSRTFKLVRSTAPRPLSTSDSLPLSSRDLTTRRTPLPARELAS